MCCFFDGNKDASAGAEVDVVDRFCLSPLFRFCLAKPSWSLLSIEPPSQRSTRSVSCAVRGYNVWNWAVVVVVVVVLVDAVRGGGGYYFSMNRQSRLSRLLRFGKHLARPGPSH
jgi:hypothetical protein